MKTCASSACWLADDGALFITSRHAVRGNMLFEEALDTKSCMACTNNTLQMRRRLEFPPLVGYAILATGVGVSDVRTGMKLWNE